MTATNARKARTMTAPTTEPTTAGILVQRAREHASENVLSRLAAAREALTARSRIVGIVGDDGAVHEELADQLAAELEKGGTVPAGYSDTVAAAIADRRARADEARVIRHARQILADRVAEVTRTSADGALAWLDEQLQALMAHVRTSDLDGITTVQAAVDAGPAATNAWQALRGHANQYREIRSAQRILTADARGGSAFIPRDVHWAGTTRIPFDEVYAEAVGDVATWMRQGYNEGRVYDPDPWPAPIITDGGTPEVVPSTDPAAFLLWLAARGDAWIPTSTELQDALEARRIAIATATPMGQLSESDDVRVDGLRHLDRIIAAATR